MARRLDTGWRDGLLAARHNFWGYDTPAPGMKFTMIEYDRGAPLAVVNYLCRGDNLPVGGEVSRAYHAFGKLYRATGEQLPFFSVRYDPRNWSYAMFAHNDSAKVFLNVTSNRAVSDGWSWMTERQFASNLYRLRGRIMPDLEPYGVSFSDAPRLSTDFGPDDVPSEAWQHQLMSVRRRNFEPESQTRMVWRNPCLDVDFAVVDLEGRVSLLVDYKASAARINLKSANAKALSAVHGPYNTTGPSTAIAAMLVSYEPTKPQWGFKVHCLNKAARLHLSYVLSDGNTLAGTVAGDEWVTLDEKQWVTVLRVAQDL